MNDVPELQTQIRVVGREIWKACGAALAAILILVAAGLSDELHDEAVWDPLSYDPTPPNPLAPWFVGAYCSALLLDAFFLYRAWKYRFPGFLPNRYVFPLFVAGTMIALACLGMVMGLLFDD
ncbi:MAG: hypothetical protein ACPG31_06755 [Planctomycetota bacterium]